MAHCLGYTKPSSPVSVYVGIQRQYFLLGITSCGSPKEPPKQTVHIGGPIRHRNQPQWEPSLFLLTLAICDRIVVYAFGYNNKGQVGYDTSTASISVPTIVPGMSIFLLLKKKAYPWKPWLASLLG